MAGPKPKRRPDSPKEAALRDRVERARRSQPRWDARGEYLELAAELARKYALDCVDIYGEFCERTAVRVYLGELDTNEAERLAWQDTRERFERQGALAV